MHIESENFEELLTKVLQSAELPNGISAEPQLSKYQGSDNPYIATKHEDGVLIGYLTHDSHPFDFFEDGDCNGVLKKFSYRSELDDFIKAIESEGQIAFLVEKYAHGNVHYSVAGTRNYPDRRFDVGLYGVYVPDEYLQDEFKAGRCTKEELTADSNSTLDEYSKWCNGETYCFVTETWERNEAGLPEKKDYDVVGGYIGLENANDALRQEMGLESPEPTIAPYTARENEASTPYR
ncbi:hypothetical protein ACQU0X_25975 [Pseudovibrio ascidiaceicola]|uniref:hypothetical protein n=1 Tax=Pseudovibrio ascidiaceicola TaxID=285279 RepID=UPI003D36BB94